MEQEHNKQEADMRVRSSDWLARCPVGSWGQLLRNEMFDNGEHAADFVCEMSDDELCEVGSPASYGNKMPGGFIAWTSEWVYYDHEYDSSHSCSSIRRNPPRVMQTICPKCKSHTQVFTDRSGNFGCWRVGCSMPLPPANDKMSGRAETEGGQK